MAQPPLTKLSEKLAACTGKRQFNSKAAALKQRRYGHNKMLVAYRCPHCHMFHLGAK